MLALSTFWCSLRAEILIQLSLLRTCSFEDLKICNGFLAASDCPQNDLFLFKNKIPSKSIFEVLHI